MSLFNQMKQIKGKVEYLLKKTPHLRDDDFKLIATFWWHEIGNEKCKLMNGMELLQFFSDGKLTSEKSIVRVRAKLQEQVPELRGKSYQKRKGDSDDISNNIHGL